MEKVILKIIDVIYATLAAFVVGTLLSMLLEKLKVNVEILPEHLLLICVVVALIQTVRSFK